MHCASLTAHNKMAAIIKSIQSNIIEMKLTSLSHSVQTVISRCKFWKKGLFCAFLPLPHTCHFETRPSPLLIIGENACGAHFLHWCRKKEYSDPHFLFHNFNKNSASFKWEKNLQKSMFIFLAILFNGMDWAITSCKALLQIKSSLERKLKQGHRKAFFLYVSGNKTKSNSVW